MGLRSPRSLLVWVGRGLLAALGAVIVAGVATVAIARALYLPDTTCRVTRAAVDTVELEVPYAAVVAALGCDGVRVARTDHGGKLVIETYRWRGDAWPFGLLEATFYDGVIHARHLWWLDLQLARTRPTGDTAAPTRL